MISFVYHYEKDFTTQLLDDREGYLFTNKKADALSIMRPDGELVTFTAYDDSDITIGQLKAWSDMVNARIDYLFYGVDQRFQLVRDYFEAFAEGSLSKLLRLERTIEEAQARYVDTAFDDLIFAQRRFHKAGHDWLWQTLGWDDVPSEFMAGYRRGGNRYFKA